MNPAYRNVVQKDGSIRVECNRDSIGKDLGRWFERFMGTKDTKLVAILPRLLSISLHNRIDSWVRRNPRKKRLPKYLSRAIAIELQCPKK